MTHQLNTRSSLYESVQDIWTALPYKLQQSEWGKIYLHAKLDNSSRSRSRDIIGGVKI